MLDSSKMSNYVGEISAEVFCTVCRAYRVETESDQIDENGLLCASFNLTPEFSMLLVYSDEADSRKYISIFEVNRRNGLVRQLSHEPAYYNTLVRAIKGITRMHADAMSTDDGGTAQ